MLHPCRSFAAFALCATATLALAADGDRPLAHSPYDPQAKQMDLFAAMEEGIVDVRLVAQDSTGGNLFLKNTSKEPLTVKMPAGFVGIPIHAQFFPQTAGNAPGASIFGAGSQPAAGSGNGGPQAVGAGTGPGQAQAKTGSGPLPFGANSPFGPGFFSIPAEKTLRVPYHSVCLNHGLQDPSPRASYTIIPIERYTDDPVLQTLIARIGGSFVDQHAAQAATWKVANGLSWEELRSKGRGPIPNVGDPYFSSRDIALARQMVDEVTSEAAREPATGKTALRPRKSSDSVADR